jgi:hypothetical protein
VYEKKGIDDANAPGMSAKQLCFTLSFPWLSKTPNNLTDGDFNIAATIEVMMTSFTTETRPLSDPER